MKRRLTAILCLALSGCINSHLTKHIPTMEADSPETGLEGLALTNEMRRAYATIQSDSYCRGTMPQHQDSETYTYARYQNEPNALNAGRVRKPTALQYECIGFDKDKLRSRRAIEDYLHAGFGLTDYYCDVFFRRVALHASARHYGGAIANDVGTAMSAILGLTGAGSVATGATGAAFGLIDAGFRNYDAIFLITPDLGTLQRLVFKAQKDFQTGMEVPDSLPQANSAILRYANFCTFVGMKGLLNKSLSDADDVATIKKYMVDFVAAAEAAKANRKDAKAAGTVSK